MAKGAIIVGAGPVGLMLAGELRLGGAEVTVYDRLPAPSGESRGLGFNRRTAEVFDQRGLLERLGEIRWGRQGHFGGVRIDFTSLRDNHFGVMGLAQSHTEEVLERWLGELGVRVRRGYRVHHLTQDDTGVTVDFEGPDGPGSDRAQYLVGCDGARSTVRRLAGIDFPGLPATRGMYMADVVGADLPMRPIGEHAPGGGMTLSVNLEEGVDRIVIHEPGVRPQHAEREVTFTEIADAWQRMKGQSIHHARARWMTALTNATGLAEHYRRGRVFLAGDAAHDHAPLAAQGISAGVQDAVNLGWKLAAAIAGWAPEGLLDTYHSERHPVGEQLIRDVLAQSLLYLSGPEMEPLREVMRELVQLPETAHHLAATVSGLGIRYDVGTTGHPLLGLRMPPDQQLQPPHGPPTRIAELLHTAHGTLITTDPHHHTTTAHHLTPWKDRINHHTGTWIPHTHTPHTLPPALLLRPDGHIIWTAPHHHDLTPALTRWFGPPTP